MIRTSSLAVLAIAAVACTDLAIANGASVRGIDSTNGAIVSTAYGAGPSGFLGIQKPSPPRSVDADPPPFTAKKPKINVEEVQFPTGDKLTLTASFYPPRRKGRAPAAMLIHDAGADRSGLEKTAVHLQKRGFAVLALDLRGHGASVSEGWNWTERTENDQFKLWTFALRDLEAATKYLRSRKDVHNSNLSLVGVGAGGALATRYALNDESARALVLIDPSVEALGYDIFKDVVGLGGLPTLIMIQSDRRSVAERMQREAHRQNDGLQFVQIKTVKPKGDDPLGDPRVPSEVLKFLNKEAMPKR